jgi:hypothetical protein
MYEGRCARTPFSFVVAGRGSPGIMAEEFDGVVKAKRHPCVQSPPVDNRELSTGGDWHAQILPPDQGRGDQAGAR